MRDILEAVATFLIACAVGAVVYLVAVAAGLDSLAAGGIQTAVTLAVGLGLCQRRKKA